MKKHTVPAIALIIGLIFSFGIVPAIWAAEDRVIIDRTTRSKTLNDYSILTRDSIQRAWKPAGDPDIPTNDRLSIRIDYSLRRSGALDSVRLLEGSGDAALDASLVEAIRKAEPFPPFPEGVNAKSILIRANFIIAAPDTPQTVTAQNKEDSDQESLAAADEEARRKLRWGLPAGSAKPEKPAEEKETEETSKPKRKLYKWGLPE